MSINEIVRVYIITDINSQNQLVALHLNIQSLPSKFEALEKLINTLDSHKIEIDFIILCETFLHEGNKDLFILAEYNLVSKHRTKMSRGGVAIYIKEKIQYKLELCAFAHVQLTTTFSYMSHNVTKCIFLAILDGGGPGGLQLSDFVDLAPQLSSHT